MNDRIRTLRPGEPIPDGEPRRYVDGAGYVKLRWKIAPRCYVETREHRVVAGVVTANHVHHIDGDPANNSPDNLVVLTAAEHRTAHRVLDHDLIVRLYASGLTTLEVGAEVGCNPATVSRILRSAGVPARKGNGAHRRFIARTQAPPEDAA